MNLRSELLRRGRRPVAALATAGLGLALLAGSAHAAPADAPYELTGASGALVRADGTTPANLAGERPDALQLDFGIVDNHQDAPDPLPNPLPSPSPWREPRGITEHVRIDLPVGMAANPAAFPTCTDEHLLNLTGDDNGPNPAPPEQQCSPASQIGWVKLRVRTDMISAYFGRTTVEARIPVYNMTREPGQPGRFAFNPGQAPANVLIMGDLSPVEVIGEVRPDDQGMSFTLTAPPSLPLLSAEMVIWGTPGLEAHDELRTKSTAWIGADKGKLGKPDKLSQVGSRYGDAPVEDRTTAFRPTRRPVTGH